MDLKNLNIDDIKAKVLSMADKKTLIKFGIGIGSIVFFLIIYYSILNPIVQTKKVKLNEMLNKKDEIVKFEKEIKTNKAKIKKIKPDYLKHSTLFHSKAEVEGLYQSLSQHAGINGLVISKIEKKDPIAVYTGSGKKKKKKKKKNKGKKDIVYYKIPVNFEIKGSFLGYIKFKRAISLSRKMLNFDKETVQLVKGDTTGAIVAKGVLTIVGLTNEFN